MKGEIMDDAGTTKAEEIKWEMPNLKGGLAEAQKALSNAYCAATIIDLPEIEGEVDDLIRIIGELERKVAALEENEPAV